MLTSDVMAPTLPRRTPCSAAPIAVFPDPRRSLPAILLAGLGVECRSLSGMAQAKGWPYHVLPALSTAMLLAALPLSQGATAICR